ncbi:Nuclear-pore anchor [Dorcoceras hygrometricum]|uniref:Nuclear-pore anchor n=1 Tax=Dorcoceras hygrometricum TaxID=472368 RepID=A0A2Z7A630_9LAMI|nr:Nuclear-pore anchor [Dorcoceras hygrometricum]
MCAPLRDAAPSLTPHARPARMVPALACARGAREGAAACGGGRDCGSLRQFGPRPDPRLLRQAALEALTRSARTNTPRKTRPEQFPAKWRRRRAAHGGGEEEGREAACGAISFLLGNHGGSGSRLPERQRKNKIGPGYDQYNSKQSCYDIHMVFLGVTSLETRAWLRPVSRGNRHFTIGGGRLRQSGPRSEARLLCQPTLEGLTRSARTDSPRQVGRNNFRRGEAAAAAAFEERRGGHLELGLGPKNLKISKSTKTGPISNIGPKTSRVARDRPEQKLGEISRHDIAGASPERRPPPQNHVRRKAERGRTAAQPIARPASGAKQRPATTFQSRGQRTKRRDIVWPARKRPASEWPTGATSCGHLLTRKHRFAHPFAGHGQRSRAMHGRRAGFVHGAVIMGRRHARRRRGRCDVDFASVFLWVTSMATRAWLRPVSRGNRHFTVGGGRLRQSGPRSEARLLRHPALEGLTRSARTDSPRQVGRNNFRRGEAAAAQDGGGF